MCTVHTAYVRLFSVHVDPDTARGVQSYVLFPKIEVVKLESKCYELHVFVVSLPRARPPFFASPQKKRKKIYTKVSPEKIADGWKTPELIEEFCHDESYAGAGMIFGRGKECETCRSRKPFDITVEVTHTLRTQNLKLRLSTTKRVRFPAHFFLLFAQ